MSLVCKIFGHKINRRRVRKVGGAHFGRCRRCEAHLRRTSEGWVTYNPHKFEHSDDPGGGVALDT